MKTVIEKAVGKSTRNPATKSLENNIHFVHGNQNTFVSMCDGITFGAENGKPFDNFKRDSYTLEEKLAWAKNNSNFFKSLAERLDRYIILLG